MRFEDYFEIMQTIARYGHALDSADVTFSRVLTDDVVFDMRRAGGPVVRGRSEVLRVLTGSPDEPSSRPGARGVPMLSHHTTNAEIVADRGDEVDVRSKFVRPGGHPLTPMPLLIGQYLDTLRRTPDGWLISSRSIVSHGV